MYPMSVDSQGQSLLVHILRVQIQQTGWVPPDVPQLQKDKRFFLWGPSAMSVSKKWMQFEVKVPLSLQKQDDISIYQPGYCCIKLTRNT